VRTRCGWVGGGWPRRDERFSQALHDGSAKARAITPPAMGANPGRLPETGARQESCAKDGGAPCDCLSFRFHDEKMIRWAAKWEVHTLRAMMSRFGAVVEGMNSLTHPGGSLGALSGMCGVR
jgi:hypothetical protein